MSRSEFDFKKHQNLSKSWKMLIRFLVYAIVIAVILILMYYTNKSPEELENEEGIEQIHIEMDGIEME